MVVATTTRPIEQLVRDLQRRDVEIWVEAERLRTRAAKGAITPELRVEIQVRKAELMAFLNQVANAGQTLTIEPVAHDGELPLSSAQQGIWFLAQMGVESAFNFVYQLRLRGTLNRTALQRALTEIVRRHAVFRTTFSMQTGTPQQQIQPPTTVALPLLELQQLSPAEQAAEVTLLVQQEAAQRFDLEQDLLLRAKLLCLQSKSGQQETGRGQNGHHSKLTANGANGHAEAVEEEHLLLLTMNHIAFDGWSVGVLRHELERLYNAYLLDVPSPLPALPLQYADYAVWQRQQLQERRVTEQLAYWKRALADVPQLLQLPTDYVRPAYQSYRGGQIDFVIDPMLTSALKQLSQTQEVTLFMTLLAAFELLLYRYTEQEDFAVGTVIANRQQQALEPLIGLFVNTLALRADLATRDGEELTFRELLTRVRHTTQDAYDHQDLPFERLVDELQVERSLSHNALVQVAFAMQNTPQEPICLMGLAPEQLSVSTVHHTRYDIELHIFEAAGQLQGTFVYSTDLFAEATMARMVGHLQTLLAAIIANPDEVVGRLPLLTAAERHHLLVERNNTVTEYPKDKCVHQLFETQVKLTPNATAIIYDSKQGDSIALTYRELNERANQLGRYLQSFGVNPGTPIGICMERSVDMIVGLLGILKSGCAYVPIDISYPDERIAFMLEDAQAAILLTQQDHIDLFAETETTAICLDVQWDEISHQPITNLNLRVDAESPAYIIYTSGSTGVPKGAIVPHRAINRLLYNTNYIEFLSTDRIAQASNASFDAATFEIWGALLNGATLVGTPRGVSLDPQLFAEYIQSKEINILFLTTALFNQMVRAVPNIFSSLKYLLFGGEAVDPTTVRMVLQHGAPIHLLHVYGPTESTTFSTWYPVQSVPDNASTVPIGGPLANTQLYVLDRFLNPVPIGIVGELHIGGDGLALGYLNRAELTAEKFIVNSFGAGRLYKTGDLVRWLSKGVIEFVGRADSQVKIRGFRIELGEIETVLTQHSQVQEALVLTHTEATGQKRLVAYVIVEDSKKLGNVSEEYSTHLRAYLKDKLPDYMVPTAFVQMKAFPLTPNGKINRNALPTPEWTAPSSSKSYVPPSTSVEITLANIWSEILGVESIGIYDNFFELGGDSIIGIQIASCVQQAGIHLKPRHLFEAQTIAELTRLVNGSHQPLVEAQPQDLATGDVPLLPIQAWFFEHHAINCNHFNQSLVETVDRKLDREHLVGAIAHLLQHHDALRLRYTPTAKGWQQSYDALAEVPVSDQAAWWAAAESVLHEIDLSGRTVAEQEAALEHHNRVLQGSLNIMTGPLLSIVHIKMGATQSDRLLFIIHHLAVDLVSWRIIMPDFWHAYDQLVAGQPVTLPPKSSSVKAWGEWLEEYAQSDALLDELDYWLSTAQTTASLPTDFPPPAIPATVATSDTVTYSLSIAETEALLQEAPAAYQTQINDLLLTALTQTIAAWTGNSSVQIDLEGHGREALTDALDLSRTVGWFTSLFPVSLQLESDELGEAIKSIKEQLRRIPQRGIGYGVLRYLNPATAPQLAALSQAQISFNYGGQFKALQVSSLGDEWSEATALDYHFAITGAVADEQLSITWTYSRDLYQRETVERLAADLMTTLQALIAHCQDPDAGGYTPSDFADIDVEDQTELDTLLATIGDALEG